MQFNILLLDCYMEASRDANELWWTAELGSGSDQFTEIVPISINDVYHVDLEELILSSGCSVYSQKFWEHKTFRQIQFVCPVNRHPKRLINYNFKLCGLVSEQHSVVTLVLRPQCSQIWLIILEPYILLLMVSVYYHVVTHWYLKLV